MNKNIMIGFLVLIVVGLGYNGFSNKGKDASSKETIKAMATDETKNYFEQNQECLRYKDGIAKNLGTKISPFGEASLEQIFYSPKQSSCLYVEYTIQKGYYNKRLFDVLHDGYSAKPLEMCSSFYPSEEIMESWKKADGDLALYYKSMKGCNDFDERLSQYR